MLTYPAVLSHPIEVPIPANDGRSSKSNNRYGDLMDSIKAAKGAWVCCVDLDMIAGNTTPKKASNLHTAAKCRKMRIRTTSQHGFIYCRLAVRNKAAL